MNIPRECPFSDKTKLELILHGKDEVCRGHQKKNDEDEYERCKVCDECRFFDKKLSADPWQFGPSGMSPAVQPSWLWPFTTTTPNTGGFNQD